MQPTAPDLQALGKRLYERRGEAVVVPFVERSLDDWRPDERECHRNVDWWVMNNPGCKAVRGWLFFDMITTSEGLLKFVWFNSHSVVEEPNGKVIDITPSRASQRYPFIGHEGDEDDFTNLVDRRKIWRIEYSPTVVG